jgi:YidC/Oxa1 family membrane protein insertase
MYNALAFLISSVPGGDVGVAVIVLTIIVRVILFPLALSASRTQSAMRKVDPELRALRDKYKDNKEELAKQTMALFRENKINPFSSIFFVLVQLPIIIGLYIVFNSEGKTLIIDPAVLYPFISAPGSSSLIFLGLIDLSVGSLVLAVLVAVTQYFYSQLLMPNAPVSTGKSFQDDLMKSMHLQMRYVFPVVLGVIAFVTSGVIALYFVVSNVFGILQELMVKRLHHEEGGGK